MVAPRVLRWVLYLVVVVVTSLMFGVGSTATAAEPCEQLRDDTPCLVFSPEQGGPGTYVTFSGYVERDDLSLSKQNFRANLHGMYHDFPDGGPTGDACELIVGLHGFQANIDPTTRKITGSFTLGSSGNCKQEERSFPTYPGRYSLTAGCVSCVFAEYRVTAAELPATGVDVRALIALGLGLCVAGGVAVASGRSWTADRQGAGRSRS